jgi:prepilin-type N-terminal cleavage/methylation domain-containing protein
MNRNLTDKRGFTLIELIITISIFAIMMAIAIPSFLTYRPTMKIKGAARDIASALQFARMKAVSENNTFAVRFSGSSYSIYDDNDNDDVYADTTDPLDIAVRTLTLPDGISFGVGTNVNKKSDNTSPAPADFITFGGDACDFSTRGTADTGTVYIKNIKNESYAVTVSSSGRVRILVWNGSQWGYWNGNTWVTS